MKQKNKISKFQKVFLLFFLLFIFSSICAFGYINTVSAHISESVFRLHIIANSDSIEDQNLKYKIRDRIIQYMNTLSKNMSSKQDVQATIQSHIDDFKSIAKEVILENGYDYDVTVQIGNFEFPTKTYGDISLPAGFYDALKIQIGDAGGQNWWCVMFPPLCFVDVTSGIVPDESKELMQEELSDEEYYIISQDTPEIKFKFKLIELFSNLTKTYTAKK